MRAVCEGKLYGLCSGANVLKVSAWLLLTLKDKNSEGGHVLYKLVCFIHFEVYSSLYWQGPRKSRSHCRTEKWSMFWLSPVVAHKPSLFNRNWLLWRVEERVWLALFDPPTNPSAPSLILQWGWKGCPRWQIGLSKILAVEQLGDLWYGKGQSS